MPSSDWSDRITWDSLGNLLVRHLGTSQAVSLLQEMDIPESSLSASFYQTCAMAGLVHRHQRYQIETTHMKIFHQGFLPSWTKSGCQSKATSYIGF